MPIEVEIGCNATANRNSLVANVVTLQLNVDGSRLGVLVNPRIGERAASYLEEAIAVCFRAVNRALEITTANGQLTLVSIFVAGAIVYSVVRVGVKLSVRNSSHTVILQCSLGVVSK